jgi:hypothetical protein
MSGSGTYIGGHTIIAQKRSDFEAELERKAVRVRKRLQQEQADFDRARFDERERAMARMRPIPSLSD